MAWLSQHRFLVLLAALLAVLVLYPPLHDRIGSLVLLNAIRTALFITGVWVAGTDRRLRAAAALLAIPTVVAVWGGANWPEVAEVGFHLAAAAFLALVAAAVARAAFRRATVTADSLGGALCGYLLVGVLFGHLFTALDLVVPGSFAGLGQAAGERRQFLLTYFSFVTLTTVGYGDITPTADLARSLSLCEAVIGQFYMAVLIAGLIGKWSGQSPAAPAASTHGH